MRAVAPMVALVLAAGTAGCGRFGYGGDGDGDGGTGSDGGGADAVVGASCAEGALGVLQLSTSFDRASPMPLDGAALGEVSFVFVEECVALDSVTFRIDSPGATPANTESTPPWDLVGTASTDDQARPLLRGMLRAGERTIYAACEASDGRSQQLVATVTAPDGGTGFNVSDVPERFGSVPLAARDLTGDAYIFYVDDRVPFDRAATFYVDDINMTGAPFNEETSAPFDLAGGGHIASPFDTTSLADGQHNVTVVVEQTGGTATVTVSFGVANP